MGLFKKLDNQLVKEVKRTEAKSVSVQERKEIEQELIYGSAIMEADLFEDAFKVTAINQGGKKSSHVYERDTKEDAKKAAIDGFDVPEEDILKIEKQD